MKEMWQESEEYHDGDELQQRAVLKQCKPFSQPAWQQRHISRQAPGWKVIKA